MKLLSVFVLLGFQESQTCLELFELFKITNSCFLFMCGIKSGDFIMSTLHDHLVIVPQFFTTNLLGTVYLLKCQSLAIIQLPEAFTQLIGTS